jgi:hypothetical protein
LKKFGFLAVGFLQISASRVSAGRWGTFAAHWDSFDSLGLLVGSHNPNKPPRDFLLKNARVYSLAVRVCEESASHEEQNFGGRQA